MPPSLALPSAPVRLVQQGAPRAGTWAGVVGDASFEALAAPFATGLAARLVEKRWVYALASSKDVFFCLAIIDLGVLSSAFCAVFDRGARRLLFDESVVLPPLLARVADDAGPGLRAELDGLQRASVVRDGDRVRVEAQWGKVRAELILDAARAPPALAVCAPIAPGRFDFTQKWVGLSATGVVRVGRTAFALDGADAGMDFTHGHLARDTSWRWAFATGACGARRVAFNFSEGFLGAGGEEGPENAVWVDGAPCAVGPVRFGFDRADPDGPWTIRSNDGGVDLTFTPEGHRAQDVDLKLVLSRYLQPFGTFRGHLTAPDGARVLVDALAGVTEDHAARW